MTVSCRLVETDWLSTRQDAPKRSQDYRNLAGRHAVDRAGTVIFSLFLREEWMSRADTGECLANSAVSVEEEVVFCWCLVYAVLVVKS